MLKNIADNGTKIQIYYKIDTELEKMLCYVIDFDEKSQLLSVESMSGSEYIFPLSVIKKIYIEGTAWKNHR